MFFILESRSVRECIGVKEGSRILTEIRFWSTGVMEYWSVEKKDINTLAITPKLQYSNTPKFVSVISSFRIADFVFL
jgi:hypothetical protein